MSVNLTKETVGRVHVTITRAHPNPLRAVRNSADACFPGLRHAITAVRPEPYDELRKFSPHVIYTVTAFRPAQAL